LAGARGGRRGRGDGMWCRAWRMSGGMLHQQALDFAKLWSLGRGLTGGGLMGDAPLVQGTLSAESAAHRTPPQSCCAPAPSNSAARLRGPCSFRTRPCECPGRLAGVVVIAFPFPFRFPSTSSSLTLRLFSVPVHTQVRAT
jgi:hypothetical protein